METLTHESFATLEAQVDALARGTNPVVYFPLGTKQFPELPRSASATTVYGDITGCGTYYFIDTCISEKQIHAAVARGMHWAILGFLQNKDEVAKGVPKVVVARDENGLELKAAAVDASNPVAVMKQEVVFHIQFPGAIVAIEDIPALVSERGA